MTTLCRKPFQGYEAGKTEYGWFYCEAPANHDGHDKGYGHKSEGAIKDRPVVTLGDEHATNWTTDGKPCIKLDIWRTVLVDGKDTGCCRREKGRPVDEIHRELVAQLQSEDLIDESFSMICHWNQREHAARRGMRIDPPYKHADKWQFRWAAPGTGGDWGPNAVVEKFDTEAKAVEARKRIMELYAMVPCALDEDEESQLLWPEGYRWIASYAVTGGSEGHYVHIDLMTDYEHTAIGTVRTPRSMFLAKTFRGMEHAQKLAARCATLLGA